VETRGFRKGIDPSAVGTYESTGDQLYEGFQFGTSPQVDAVDTQVAQICLVQAQWGLPSGENAAEDKPPTLPEEGETAGEGCWPNVVYDYVHSIGEALEYGVGGGFRWECGQHPVGTPLGKEFGVLRAAGGGDDSRTAVTCQLEEKCAHATGGTPDQHRIAVSNLSLFQSMQRCQTSHAKACGVSVGNVLRQRETAALRNSHILGVASWSVHSEVLPIHAQMLQSPSAQRAVSTPYERVHQNTDAFAKRPNSFPAGNNLPDDVSTEDMRQLQ
jgi:hypothetical protein